MTLKQQLNCEGKGKEEEEEENDEKWDGELRRFHFFNVKQTTAAINIMIDSAKKSWMLSALAKPGKFVIFFPK